MSTDKRIGTFVHLKKKPEPERAIKTLQRVAAHVMPILQKRNWHVRTLAEFYPEQKNLLGTNLNRGQKISLRLRQPFDDRSHLEFEDVMGTMLHELAHIVRGPHDEQFYGVLDTLNLEYDALLSSSAGKFLELGEGRTLGGKSAAPTAQEIRNAAIRRSRGTGQQGQKLGGTTSTLQTAKEKAAEAAQRRLFDAKWCGHGRAEDPILVDEEEEIPNDEVMITEAVTDSKPVKRLAAEVIVIESDDESPVTNQDKKRKTDADEDDYTRMKQRGLLKDSLQEHLAKLAANKPKEHVSRETMPAVVAIPGRWICGVCTLANKLGEAYCDACGTERPTAANRVGEYWICEACSLPNEKSMWMCSRCQAIKQSS